MQPQLLNALSQLMITQANEVMYIKALKDNNSPAILRTIAMQLADNYESVFKLLSYDQARGIVDKVILISLNV
jgi:acetyl-CoA carboxylase carboxyltransferase component